uniref:Uncharacterized protein n=1 Tax=Lepeophtheirus salmonis TaxID=72036 RepID=A0A0K2V837_LEPSM
MSTKVFPEKRCTLLVYIDCCLRKGISYFQRQEKEADQFFITSLNFNIIYPENVYSFQPKIICTAKISLKLENEKGSRKV